MTIKTAAVLPAKGIGDALLLMIASHQLRLAGYEVTTYHPILPELQEWFASHRLERALPEELATFDLILVENDNSQRIAFLRQLRDENIVKKLSIFYPTYSSSKHPPLSPTDYVFDDAVPMAENVALSIGALLQLRVFSKDNGLTPPLSLNHRQHLRRIIIHPTSSQKSKNWLPSLYQKTARMLKKLGFEPVFAVSPKEREEWLGILKEEFPLPRFEHLGDIASYLYESGYMIGNDSLIGHLASNLNLPTLIIADNASRMRLWRPGWAPGILLTPPPWVPNVKPLRFRERFWQHCISPRKVLSAFETLSRSF